MSGCICNPCDEGDVCVQLSESFILFHATSIPIHIHAHKLDNYDDF